MRPDFFLKCANVRETLMITAYNPVIRNKEESRDCVDSVDVPCRGAFVIQHHEVNVLGLKVAPRLDNILARIDIDGHDIESLAAEGICEPVEFR